MGTRADFYVGTGQEAEWCGSIAWDGYPSGIDSAILKATDDRDYRSALAKFFVDREDATMPAMGWPWPWDSSHTTDYAYALQEGKVVASCFGSSWFDPLDESVDQDALEDKAADVPDMSSHRNEAAPGGSKRSGLIVFEV